MTARDRRRVILAEIGTLRSAQEHHERLAERHRGTAERAWLRRVLLELRLARELA